MRETRILWTLGALYLVPVVCALLMAGCVSLPIPPWANELSGTALDKFLNDDFEAAVTNVVPITVAPAVVAQDGSKWNITWYGPSCANAKETIKIYDVVVAGGKLTWKCDATKWADGRDITVDNTVVGALFRRGDSTNALSGGKFDWVRKGQRSKGLENLLGKRKRDKVTDVPIKDADGDQVWSYYIKGVVPIKEGEDVWFVMFRSDGKEMSDIVKATGRIDRSKQKGDK